MTTVRHTCGRRSGQSARALPHGPWPGSVGAILSADTHGASRRCRHQRARPVGPRPALESSWLRTCVFKQRPWGRWHLGYRTGVWGPRVCPQTPGGESGDGSPRLCPWAAPLAPAVLRRPQGRPRSPGPGRPGQLNISAGSQGHPGPPTSMHTIRVACGGVPCRPVGAGCSPEGVHASRAGLGGVRCCSSRRARPPPGPGTADPGQPAREGGRDQLLPDGRVGPARRPLGSCPSHWLEQGQPWESRGQGGTGVPRGGSPTCFSSRSETQETNKHVCDTCTWGLPGTAITCAN